ncbi:hypothetical protein [Streptomyces asiaticus]|uniref:hypothetical protein n=1 Tax=Streptomyces asiaticus TaxID=114695 RepID=UPI003F681D85
MTLGRHQFGFRELRIKGLGQTGLKFREAAVFMGAAGPVGSAAVAQGDPAALEVAEELLPFLVGRSSVFLAGAGGAAAGDEGPVAVDDLLVASFTFGGSACA